MLSGDTEAALRSLERDVELGDHDFVYLREDPVFEPLRDDPRMQALMDELGLPNGYDPAADTYEPEGIP